MRQLDCGLPGRISPCDIASRGVVSFSSVSSGCVLAATTVVVVSVVAAGAIFSCGVLV